MFLIDPIILGVFLGGYSPPKNTQNVSLCIDEQQKNNDSVQDTTGKYRSPKKRLAGFVAKKQHAEQRAKGAAQPDHAEQGAFRDAPLVRPGAKFIDSPGQESQAAECSVIDPHTL